MTRRHLAKFAITLIVAVLSHGVAKVTAQYLWFRTSDLYTETMYLVRASEDLKKAVGTSLVVGWPSVRRSRLIDPSGGVYVLSYETNRKGAVIRAEVISTDDSIRSVSVDDTGYWISRGGSYRRQ